MNILEEARADSHSSRRQCRLWHALIALLVYSVACFSALAQQVHYLALKSDGTASVMVDERAGIAYITDGGRGTTQGIGGALIEGKPVLEYLLDQNISRLVITCSHPHADHVGGLKQLVANPLIQKFDVTFIDNDYSEVTGKPSLAQLYSSSWQDRGGRPAKYYSASGKNAFISLHDPGSAVEVNNYVYDPSSVGSDVHDSSVIMQYRFRQNNQSSQVVDFDDASTALVTRWSQDPNARVDVLVDCND